MIHICRIVLRDGTDLITKHNDFYCQQQYLMTLNFHCEFLSVKVFGGIVFDSYKEYTGPS